MKHKFLQILIKTTQQRLQVLIIQLLVLIAELKCMIGLKKFLILKKTKQILKLRVSIKISKAQIVIIKRFRH